MRRDLMADISHELRTPLAVLRGELEAIQDGVRRFTPSRFLLCRPRWLPSPSWWTTSISCRCPTRGAGLPENLTGYHHPAGSGGGRFSRALRQPAAKHSGVARGAGDDLRRPRPPDAALQQSAGEQPALYRQRRQPAHHRRRSGRMLVIDFADSAPGVSDEQLARLCERFYRAEGSRNRASGGSGLGLAICLNIVAAHGGTLRADHSPLAGLALKLSYLWNMIYRETYD